MTETYKLILERPDGSQLVKEFTTRGTHTISFQWDSRLPEDTTGGGGGLCGTFCTFYIGAKVKITSVCGECGK